MSFFDRNIDAIETAAKTVFFGSLAILALIFVTGPVGLFTLAVLAALIGAGLVLNEVADAQARMDREAAERGTQWHERLRANRERALRQEIQRLRRERGRER
ncbi:hypothetical protein ACFQ08_03525 [Streptosporangium algeriense]|uniref:DUF3040 domain-containing protein n=1 Tax=Streptosporangium algeriense TaxID=1682748 RepID=A0ABW3DIC7_9ACTN